MAWITNNKALFAIVLVVVLISLSPLYGILFPPLADLPQQILVNKLLWEKLWGTSQLDLEVSSFLGYRLPTLFILIIISFCKLCGISLEYLPKIVVMVLISFHSIVVAAILYFGLKDKSRQSYALAICFSIPAAVAMYSAAWFIGFIGFTLGITLLVPAVFLTEKFLESGKKIDAVLLFLCLFLVYAAHPFVLTFWLMWCFSRALVSVVMRSVFLEWKRIIFLGVIFSPIFLYHFLATKIYEFAPANVKSVSSQYPFVSTGYWYQERFLALFDGTYLKADETSDAGVFAIVAGGLILSSIFVAFWFKQNQDIRKAALSGVFLTFIASWINEKFIPVPEGHWLAYDYRFSTAVYVVSLALAGMIFIRSLPVPMDKPQYRTLFIILAFFSVFASIEHLIDVQNAYARFDAPAREYIAKVFNHEQPTDIALPRARWYPDGTHLRRYICLQQPDCNPAGTLFRNLGGDIYPVKLKSTNRILTANAVNPAVEPVNAFKGGEGYAGGQFSKPRGIAVDKNGNLYVADTGNGRVQIFDADGNFISAFGRTGDKEGEFKEPNGIAVDSEGNIYVVDVGNHKLIKFAPDGKFAKEWNQSKLLMYGPRDLAIGRNGELYIVDQGRMRIVKFNPATETFTSWGTAGEDKGQFKQPTGITINGDFVFVADLGNNRVQVFDLDGKFVRQIAVEAWGKYVWNYADAAYDEQTKRLYLTNGWRKEVLVFDIEGNFIESLKSDAPAELNNASSIVLSKTENGKRLYVLNTGSDAFDAGEPKVSVFELSNSSSQ